MYLWTLLTWEPGDPPSTLGITDDLARARRVTEPYLESGQARVCCIEQVRFAMTAADMSSCYARTGRYWSGELTEGGGVAWSEHWGFWEHGGTREHEGTWEHGDTREYGGIREHGETRGRPGGIAAPGGSGGSSPRASTALV